MNKTFNRLLLKLRLKQKLMLSYLLLILFPILYLQLHASGKVAGIIQEMVGFSMDQSFDQTHSFLSYKLKRIIDASDLIALSEEPMTRVLTRDPDDYSLYEQLQDGNKLSDFLSSFRDSSDISGVRLYMPNTLLFSNEGSTMYRLNDVRNSAWFKELETANVKLMWFAGLDDSTASEGGAPAISLVRLIRNPDRYNETIGLLRLDIEERILKDIVSRANSVEHSLTYLQRNDGQILIASDETLLREYLPDQGSGTLRFHQMPIPQTDLTMVTAIPYSEIVSKSTSLQRNLLFSFLAVGLLAMGLAHLISLHMTRRITMLSQKMKSLESGVLEPIVKPPGEDEIGELIQSYNYMSRQLALLKNMEVKAIKSEMKALQSQINPHFLYNTLDQINWMAQFGMNDQIASLVQSLAGYYKLTLSNGQDIIPIEQELKLVAYYVDIQNVRFEQKIELTVEVDKEIQAGLIPKLTLQPIVENAILHGILRSDNREGSITIACERQEERIVLSVIDDGVGMDESSLTQLRAGARGPNPSGSGYGLRNVQERIKLYYGESYGLHFLSSPGDGTIVEIHIPLLMDMDAN